MNWFLYDNKFEESQKNAKNSGLELFQNRNALLESRDKLRKVT